MNPEAWITEKPTDRTEFPTNALSGGAMLSKPKPSALDRILIVDDSELFPVIIKGFLRDEEFEVIVRESAEDGIVYLKNEGPISVVISDFEMPGMNGIEFLNWIKTHSPHTFRILFSSHIENHINKTAPLQKSAHSFFSKPGKCQDVRDLVQLGREHYKYQSSQNEALP